MTREPPPFNPAQTARAVLAGAGTGALATLGEHGAPFASLVTLATDAGGAPLMLLSDLAEHTRNLKRDQRASLLVVAAGGEGGAALAGARVSLVGTVAVHDTSEARQAFLTRHREAARSSALGDFHLYRMTVQRAHVVAGFGRIADVEGTELG